MPRTLAVTPVLAAALLVPSAAAAAPGTETIRVPFGPQVEFSVRASNGYSIIVEGGGRKARLSVIGGLGFAVYRVRGRVSPEGIRARFGNRGRVAVEFRPSGRVRRREPPRSCKGKARITRSGVFVGTIGFRGERGYTRVHVRRARGSTRTSPRWRCKRRRGVGQGPPPQEPASSEELTILEATAKGGRLLFGAFRLSPPKGKGRGIVAFLAGSNERWGRMRVSRFAFEFAREQTFTFDEMLTSATVKPPRPFAGRGSFLRGPGGSTSWTGSLTVSLPGAEDIALTGSRYKARLIQPETLSEVSARQASSWLPARAWDWVSLDRLGKPD